MANVKNNLRANAFPQTTDDETLGYSIGSLWFFDSVQFQCTDATEDAAVWEVVSGAGLIRLQAGTINSAATLDIDLSDYTAFRGFRINLNLLPATDAASLWCRVSTDGGVTYDDAASAYKYGNTLSYPGSDSPWGGVRSEGDTKIVLSPALANGASAGWKGRVEILDNFNTATLPSLDWSGVAIADFFAPVGVVGAGYRVTGQDTTALRFIMSSGNIASGKYALYGYA